MIIGVPKEVKADEPRVSLTPDKVDGLVRSGHRVIVQAGSGDGANFRDQDFQAIGATIVDDAQHVFDEAEMVVKVKEPQPHEYPLLREGQILFTYLHLAPDRELTEALLAAKVTGVAYETVEERDGSLPLLYPMSEIAGKLAPLIAARLLQSHAGGPGKLLSRIPGIEPCRVTIVGGGTVGMNAANVARSVGANVTITDIDLDRLRNIDHVSHGTIQTVYSTSFNLSMLLSRADVVIGAVLQPGAKTPKVITRALVDQMREHTILIDVAIDQGGAVEGIRQTTHSDPTYMVNGVVHYAVPNIPGMVANTSSISLSNATYPYVLKIANEGLDKVIREAGAIAKGINTLGGRLTHPAVAQSLGLEHVAVEDALVA